MGSVEFVDSDVKMPALFIGHGSPLNAIENNEFSLAWAQVGKSLPRPKAILCISAHWETAGTHVTAMELPRTIHDFFGFPQPLYEVKYPAPGSPDLARLAQKTVRSAQVRLDEEWGLDHGAMIHYRTLGEAARLSIPTNEHYLPMLYVLALQDKNDRIEIFTDKVTLGSISMRSLRIG